MQIADGIRVPGTVNALVKTHGPAGHPLRSHANPLGRLADIGFRNAGNSGYFIRRIVLQEFLHALKTGGEPGDKVRVRMAVLNKQMQQSVQQGKIRSGPDLHEQICFLRRCGPPGVNDNQPGPGLHPVHHPKEQNRMTIGHIGANDKE
ncbi:hypothetical protein D3C74_408510 [compost metagenome]